MPDITADRLQIAYDGPGIKGGRMSMLALAAGLRGQALLIQRVGYLYFAKRNTLEVEADFTFEEGSLIAPVHILTNGVQHAEHFLTDQPTTAVATLLGILGFFKVDIVSVYSLFRRLKGRPVRQPSDLPNEIGSDVPIEVLVAIYNDKEVQKLLRQVLEPLRLSGISEFETRRNSVTIVRVSKKDVAIADELETADNTKDEEVDLGIEKAAWRRDLDWHFTDGSTSFDASIEDKQFWERVDKGEAFAVGDRMRVHLQTTAHRTRKGVLRIQRKIPFVISVEHASPRKQITLFGER